MRQCSVIVIIDVSVPLRFLHLQSDYETRFLERSRESAQTHDCCMTREITERYPLTLHLPTHFRSSQRNAYYQFWTRYRMFLQFPSRSSQRKVPSLDRWRSDQTGFRIARNTVTWSRTLPDQTSAANRRAKARCCAAPGGGDEQIWATLGHLEEGGAAIARYGQATTTGRSSVILRTSDGERWGESSSCTSCCAPSATIATHWLLIASTLRFRYSEGRHYSVVFRSLKDKRRSSLAASCDAVCRDAVQHPLEICRTQSCEMDDPEVSTQHRKVNPRCSSDPILCGDLPYLSVIATDLKIQSEWRLDHRTTLVIENRYSEWLQSYPTKMEESGRKKDWSLKIRVIASRIWEDFIERVIDREERRVKDGIVTALISRGRHDELWDVASHWHYFLRNITGQEVDDRTEQTKRDDIKFFWKRVFASSGAKVTYELIDTKTWDNDSSIRHEIVGRYLRRHLYRVEKDDQMIYSPRIRQNWKS